jgi:hypothetical protein
MKVPPTILSGFIVVLSVIGAYGVRNNIFDVYVCMSVRRHRLPDEALQLPGGAAGAGRDPRARWPSATS